MLSWRLGNLRNFCKIGCLGSGSRNDDDGRGVAQVEGMP